MIQTKKVTNRRSVRFQSLDEVVQDLEMLAAAEQRGELKELGNWPLGTASGHLAAFIEYAFDGYPMKPPIWIVRVLARMMKKRFTENGLPAGMRMPGRTSGTYGDEPMTTQAGLTRFKAAAMRLERQAPALPNPVFGNMSHEEWIKLHLRHAELHLSFYRTN
jgi:hypothetical protein